MLTREETAWRWLVAILLACVVIGASAADSLILHWAHDEKDVEGNPEELHRAEYALTQPTDDPNSGGVPVSTLGTDLGEWRDRITPLLDEAGFEAEVKASILAAYRADEGSRLLEGLPPGDYRPWVRVADLAGNQSAWTGADTLVTKPDATPPTLPGELRVEVSGVLTLKPLSP